MWLSTHLNYCPIMAGMKGLEPSVLVLETNGLPVNRHPYANNVFMAVGVGFEPTDGDFDPAFM